MKKLISISAAALSLTIVSGSVLADNELVVYLQKNSIAFEGARLSLDGDDEVPVPASGLVRFDLLGGGHSLQVLHADKLVHSFRFSSADGQLADVAIILDADEQPAVAVDTYFKTESSVERAAGGIGEIRGVVNLGGKPVTGAKVKVQGADLVTMTADDGRYGLSLPRGVYELEVSHEAATEVEFVNVRAIANLARQSDIYLKSSSASSAIQYSFDVPEHLREVEEVVVVSTVNPSAFGESEQFSASVVNTISIEELARFGDTDVAASVIRVPSVTVQDNKYVFIRGLGGRYITTTLNGAAMPSTDPTKRTVPLDLFPSNMVDQLDIKKTFLAPMPGESTGGNLVINTRSFPEERGGKLSVSLGYNSAVTGDTVSVDPTSSGFDVLGWDGGQREEPAIVGAIVDTLAQREFLSSSAITELNRVAAISLLGDLDLDTATATPNASIGLNFGDVFLVGDNSSELGYFFAANYKNSWSRQADGIARTFNTAGETQDDFSFDKVTNNIDSSGLLSFGLNADDSSYKAVTLVSRSTDSTVTTSDGFDGDALEQSRRHTIEWVERQFISQQFSGEHFVNESFIAQWQLTASQATRLAPDRREVRFDQEAAPIFNLEVANLLRRYDDLTDDNIDFAVDFDYDKDFDTDFSWYSKFEFGLQLISRERDSDSATYGFNGNILAVSDEAPNLLVSDVINVDTITGDQSTGFTFQDKTLASDSYQAEMDLRSAYLSWDNSLFDSLQLILGVRYEDYEQRTDTFRTEGAQNAVSSLLDEAIALPSLALNWSFSDSQQLRVAVSKTVSRPDFKETSNAVFFDNEFSDVRVRGNPNLKVSEIVNYDVRWEAYGDNTDKLSVAFFYKDLTDAIERVALTASGTAGNSRTFENAESAEIYGVELDAKREFSLNDAYTQAVFVALNASFIESEAQQQGQLTRNLQGQPEYTFNLIVGWDDLERGQELTLLLNQNGTSIRDVGINNLPDILEEPRLELNLTYSISLNDNFSVKAKVKNLLDEDVEFTQGGNTFRSYSKGASFEAGLDWKF